MSTAVKSFAWSHNGEGTWEVTVGVSILVEILHHKDRQRKIELERMKKLSDSNNANLVCRLNMYWGPQWQEWVSGKIQPNCHALARTSIQFTMEKSHVLSQDMSYFEVFNDTGHGLCWCYIILRSVLKHHSHCTYMGRRHFISWYPARS